MMRNKLVFLTALATIIGSCKGGSRPIVQAQFCLTGAHNDNELRQTLKEIARDEGMDFLSTGEIPSSRVAGNGSSIRYHTLPRAEIMAIRSADDQVGLSASVNGSPSNQVMMGFTTTSTSKSLSAAFSKRVLARLRSKWAVHSVSGDSAMRPLTECASDSPVLQRR